MAIFIRCVSGQIVFLAERHVNRTCFGCLQSDLLKISGFVKLGLQDVVKWKSELNE